MVSGRMPASGHPFAPGWPACRCGATGRRSGWSSSPIRLIVWQGRRPPAVTAIAADGSRLASLNPDLDHVRLRAALRRRLRQPVLRRQLAPGVLQYGPGLRSRPR